MNNELVENLKEYFNNYEEFCNQIIIGKEN